MQPRTRIEYCCIMPSCKHKHGDYLYWGLDVGSHLFLHKGDSIGPCDPVFGVQLQVGEVNYNVVTNTVTICIETHDLIEQLKTIKEQDEDNFMSEVSRYHEWLESIGYVKLVEEPLFG